MSFNIGTVGPVSGQQPAIGAARRADRVAGAAPHRVDEAVTVDALTTTPPPEVHAAMGVAAHAYEQLAAKGRALSFQINDRTGKVTVEVHDLRGNVLFTVPASKALQIADGGSLE